MKKQYTKGDLYHLNRICSNCYGVWPKHTKVLIAETSYRALEYDLVFMVSVIEANGDRSLIVDSRTLIKRIRIEQLTLPGII